MRARTISGFNFERGQDPKKTMNIGQTYLDNRFIQETEWFVKFDPAIDIPKELIKDYRGLPILGYESTSTNPSLFIATSTVSNLARIGKDIPEAIEKVKKLIDGLFTPFKISDNLGKSAVIESTNFERGQDPKKSMGIGQSYLDRKFIEDTDWYVYDKYTDEPVDLIRDYKGLPILLSKATNSNGPWYFIATSTAVSMIAHIGSQNMEETLKAIKRKIDDLNNTREGIIIRNFKW